MYTKHQQIITQALKKAGDSLVKSYYNFNRSDIRLKDERQIVTSADLISEKIIIREIKKHFPAHHIISEEIGEIGRQGDYTWIIDPLDGTHNFARRNPLFSTMAALLYKNEIILGAIYIPFTKFMFTAQKGKGAFLNGKRIQVSKVEDLKKAFLIYCFGYKASEARVGVKQYSYFRTRGYHIKQYGSAGAELAWVAAGFAEAYFAKGLKPWDGAAGYLIVKEAGGQVTDFKGREWSLRSDEILCSNGVVQEELLGIIKKISRTSPE